ncbi:hypothetical protein J3E69DRAFT_320600 [Trichoderma sp. SZMC 28015]
MTPRNPEGRFITMKRQQATTPAGRGTGARGRRRVTRSQATPSRPASSSTGRNRRQAIVVEDQERPYIIEYIDCNALAINVPLVADNVGELSLLSYFPFGLVGVLRSSHITPPLR